MEKLILVFADVYWLSPRFYNGVWCGVHCHFQTSSYDGTIGFVLYFYFLSSLRGCNPKQSQATVKDCLRLLRFARNEESRLPFSVLINGICNSSKRKNS